MKNKNFRNGMTAIAELKDIIYKDKTQLSAEDVEILKKIDQIQDAYENLFILYAHERMKKGE